MVFSPLSNRSIHQSATRARVSGLAPSLVLGILVLARGAEALAHVDQGSWASLGDRSQSPRGAGKHRTSSLERMCARGGGCHELCASGEAGSAWLLVQPETGSFDVLGLAKERKGTKKLTG